MVIRVLFALRSRETELTMNFTGKVTVVGLLLSFCFLKAGLSTRGEDLRRRLEQVENRKSYKEITCDVAKCGSRKESRNNSNVPARITCIPHSITEERHLISDFYVKPTETIQSCQEVTSGCQRFPRMYTYYPHTTFNRTIDVGVCAGSCGNQLSCRPVWTNQKAIATPNGERLIPVIKSCSCVKPSCYRVAKYEAFAELYTDDQGKNATRTKLVDMGHCESERMCPFSKRGLPTSCGFQLKYISILSAAGSYTTVAPIKRCTCGD
ncbi:hypothetical protein ABFA07_007234 [Porites harrisoni]